MNRINLICLGVKSVAKSLAFYKSLGFVTYEKDDNPPIVFFDNAGTKLELYEIGALAQDIHVSNPPTPSDASFKGFTLACNMKTKQEVDELFALAKEVGAKILKEPELAFWGGYSGYFADPDGYVWEVAHADSWQFDENDMLVIAPKE